MKYSVYIDGSCQQDANPVGGWSFVMADDKNKIIIESYGKLRDGAQNSNRAELEALYQALLFISRSKDLLEMNFHIYSDSEVVVEGVHGLAKRKSNRDLWEKIEPLCLSLIGRIDISHVEGHQSDDNIQAEGLLNKRADKLAKAGANSLIISPVNN